MVRDSFGGMAKDVTFSPINPFKLVPADNSKPAGIHSGQLDREWFVNLQDERNTPRQYFQPVEQTDKFRFAFKVSPHTSRTITVINTGGATVLTITSALSATVPGNVDSAGAQMTSYLYKRSDFNTLSGIYFIKLSITWLDATVQQWISEPFKVSARHYGTKLVDYWNLTNRDDVDYEQLPCRFSRRFYLTKGNMIPGSQATNYKDQQQNETQLYRESFRTWTAYLGHDVTGIPDYEADLFSRIFNSDFVYIDQKRMKLSDGATFNRSNIGDLYGVTTEIKEVDGLEGWRYKSNTLTVYTSPGTYPYILGDVQIGGTHLFSISSPLRITNSTVEGTTIAALNASLIDAELTGTLSISGGVITYTLGVGEQFTSASATVYANKFQFGYAPSVGPYTISIDLSWGTGVISWDTSTYQAFSTGTLQTFSHTYSSIPIATVEVWTNDLRTFAVNNPNITGVTGTLPVTLDSFRVSGATFSSNTFNFAILAPCAAVLSYLNLSNCHLTAANNMPSYTFPLLVYINFAGNQLSATINSLLVQDVRGHAVARGLYNGVLSSVQSPSVVLNPAGDSAKAQLVSMGWSVLA